MDDIPTSPFHQFNLLHSNLFTIFIKFNINNIFIKNFKSNFQVTPIHPEENPPHQ